MGCYGFGVSRTVAAAIEQHHDDKGIVWPRSLTPFHAIILPINLADKSTARAAEDIYQRLAAAGFDVLYDDRELRPGPKFKDSELLGVPLRVTVGERNLKDSKVEVYYRGEDKVELVPVDGVEALVRRFYE